MTTELTVMLDDTPGTLASLGAALGDARINVEAIHGTSREGLSTVRFIPDEPGHAR